MVIPSLILGGINAWNLWDEHWEHWKHLPPLEERVEYPYQNVRTKNFPWGDGDKTLLYGNPPHSYCVRERERDRGLTELFCVHRHTHARARAKQLE